MTRPGTHQRARGSAIRPADAASSSLSALSARRRHAAPHPALRPPPGGRGAARALRRLGDAGAVRGHPPGARGGAHRRGRVRRLAHGRGRDHRARGRGVPPARPLQRRHQDRRAAAPSTRCCAARTAACSTTSSPTALGRRALPHGHQRRQPRARPRLVRRARRGLRRRGRATPHDRLRDARRAGPRGARDRWRALAEGELPGADAHRRARAWPACRLPGLRHRLHRRGRRRAAAPARRAPARLGRAAGEGVAPAGLGARDTLRLEVCFHLYGNDLDRGPQPDRGRASAGAASSTRASSAPRRSRDARARPQTLVPFAFTGPGIPRQGNPVLTDDGRGRGHERHACRPASRSASGWPTCRSTRPPAGHRRSRWTCGASARAAEVREKPLYEKEDEQWPRRATPRT